MAYRQKICSPTQKKVLTNTDSQASANTSSSIHVLVLKNEFDGAAVTMGSVCPMMSNTDINIVATPPDSHF